MAYLPPRRRVAHNPYRGRGTGKAAPLSNAIWAGFALCLFSLFAYVMHEVSNSPGTGGDHDQKHNHHTEEADTRAAAHAAAEERAYAPAHKIKADQQAKRARERRALRRQRHPFEFARQQRTRAGCTCKFPFDFGGMTHRTCTDMGAPMTDPETGTPHVLWCDTGPACGMLFTAADRALNPSGTRFDVCVDTHGQPFDARSAQQQRALEAAAAAEEREAAAMDTAARADSAHANLQSLKGALRAKAGPLARRNSPKSLEAVVDYVAANHDESDM